MVERQLNLVLQAMAVQTTATGGRANPLVAATAAAYQRDDQRTQRMMAGTAWVANCRSWYKSASGRVTNNWPTWTVRYWYDTLRLRPSDLGLIDPEGPIPAVPARHAGRGEPASAGPTADDQSLSPATR